MSTSVSPSSSVFISYSRSDREHAEKLAISLRNNGFVVSRDVEDILPTEEWKGRLTELICEADAIVFLLSPRSAVSEVCAWEVELAASLNKKIAPIVIEDVCGSEMPQILSRLNYIFATEKDRFENAVKSLTDALSLDVEWIREHTRLTGMAIRWERAARNPDLLLRGDPLSQALIWQRNRPASVALVYEILTDYLNASHKAKELAAEYTQARLRALTKLVEPILRERVTELQVEADEADARAREHPLLRSSEFAHEMRDDIKAISNFLSTGGRWHPKAAEYVTTSDASAGYVEVYQFPCCGAFTFLRDPGIPLQFRDDGCNQMNAEQGGDGDAEGAL